VLREQLRRRLWHLPRPRNLPTWPRAPPAPAATYKQGDVVEVHMAFTTNHYGRVRWLASLLACVHLPAAFLTALPASSGPRSTLCAAPCTRQVAMNVCPYGATSESQCRPLMRADKNLRCASRWLSWQGCLAELGGTRQQVQLRRRASSSAGSRALTAAAPAAAPARYWYLPKIIGDNPRGGATGAELVPIVNVSRRAGAASAGSGRSARAAWQGQPRALSPPPACTAHSSTHSLYPLPLQDGSYTWYPLPKQNTREWRDAYLGTPTYRVKFRLPADYSCEGGCILQWWVAARRAVRSGAAKPHQQPRGLGRLAARVR
jgi:hypothetical protein